jgi:hypothetical protein
MAKIEQISPVTKSRHAEMKRKEMTRDQAQRHLVPPVVLTLQT